MERQQYTVASIERYTIYAVVYFDIDKVDTYHYFN